MATRKKWLENNWRPLAVALSALIPGAFFACGDINALVVTRGMLIEDAFYYFTIARNLLAGEGLTLDGIHQTNGFHPLHLLALLPGAALSADAFLRYAVALGVLVHATTALALYYLCRRLMSDDLAFCAGMAWALGFAARQHHLNGLETGLFLLCFLSASLAYLRARDGKRPVRRHYLVAGLMLGVCYLARVDAAFLGVAIALEIAWRLRRRSLRPLAWLAAGCIAVTLPWLLASWAYNGSPLPDSGPASRLIALEMGDGYLGRQLGQPVEPGASWADHAAKWSWLNLLFFGAVGFFWSPPFSWLMGVSQQGVFGEWHGNPLFSFFLGAPILGIACFAALVGMAGWLCHRLKVGFIFTAAMLLWFVYALYPTPPWFSIRYMALWSLVWTLLLPVALAGPLWKKAWEGRSLLSLLIALWLGANVMQNAVSYPRAVEPQGYHAAALWVRDNLPADALVGSMQGGVMSYFSERRVVNLDGVVNRAAYRALRDKRMGDYVRQQGIDYVVEYRGIMNRLFWPRSGMRPGVEMVLVREGFFDVWKVKGKAN